MTSYKTWFAAVFALLVLISEICAVAPGASRTATRALHLGSNGQGSANSPSQRAGVTLTAEDMTLIAADQPPEIRTRLSENEEARKDFAKNVRELLAVAEAAQASGVADRPVVQRQLDLMRSVVIAENYFKSLRPKQAGSATPNISETEIAEFFKDAANQQRFDQFIKDAQAQNLEVASQSIPPDQLKQVKEQLGQVLLGAQRGLQTGLDQKREVQLQILMEQSQVLARKYAQEELQEKTKATEQEIDGYIEQHPELDVRQLRSKADGVLKRARAGEDFAVLAREFSSDPGSNEKGGDLGWFRLGEMVPEFEKAAFALHPGQISEVIESKFGFHIIKLEASRLRRSGGKLKRELHARHILISWDPKAGSKSPREQAREAIEHERQTQLIDEIVSHSHVTVASDFHVDPPPPDSSPNSPPGP